MDLNFVVMIEIKATSSNLSLFLAAEEGFEPSQTESESVVLPLHNSAIFGVVCLYRSQGAL